VPNRVVRTVPGMSSHVVRPVLAVPRRVGRERARRRSDVIRTVPGLDHSVIGTVPRLSNKVIGTVPRLSNKVIGTVPRLGNGVVRPTPGFAHTVISAVAGFPDGVIRAVTFALDRVVRTLGCRGRGALAHRVIRALTGVDGWIVGTV
jgi:hypothetical protein